MANLQRTPEPEANFTQSIQAREYSNVLPHVHSADLHEDADLERGHAQRTSTTKVWRPYEYKRKQFQRVPTMNIINRGMQQSPCSLGRFPRWVLWYVLHACGHGQSARDAQPILLILNGTVW